MHREFSDTKYAIILCMRTRPDPQTDGRFQRSERSREAIVRALDELIEARVFEPTAQQVAERADVGVRTVFRHFSDMDTLYTELNARLEERAEPHLVNAPQKGPFAERVAGLIEARAQLFGLIEPYRRATAIQRWRSEFLQKQHKHFVRILRADLNRRLPELSEADPDLAESLEVLTSFETWDRLREDQRLSPKRTQTVLAKLIETAAEPLCR